jgi:hypothetical protein
MNDIIRQEYAKTEQKRNEIREALRKLEEESPQDTYDIRITQDRLAYWEGRTEGLKFALDHLQEK